MCHIRKIEQNICLLLLNCKICQWPGYSGKNFWKFLRKWTYLIFIYFLSVMWDRNDVGKFFSVPTVSFSVNVCISAAFGTWCSGLLKNLLVLQVLLKSFFLFLFFFKLTSEEEVCMFLFLDLLLVFALYQVG